MASEPPNGRVGNEVIRDQTVRLDYAHLVKKTYINCRLVYGGGLPPVLQECDFISSTFALEGPAQNTAMFLRGLAMSGPEAAALVRDIIGTDPHG